MYVEFFQRFCVCIIIIIYIYISFEQPTYVFQTSYLILVVYFLCQDPLDGNQPPADPTLCFEIEVSDDEDPQCQFQHWVSHKI